MKLYIKKYINRYFRSKNLRKVSELKEGDVMSVTIEEANFYDSLLTSYHKHDTSAVYPESLPCVILADGEDMYDTLTNTPNVDEWLETVAVGVFDMIGVLSDVETSTKNDISGITATITPSLLSYIKERYDSDDIIVFKSASNIKSEEYNNRRLFYMEEPLFGYIEKAVMVTDENVTDFYKLVTNKLIEKFEHVYLTDEEETSDELMKFYKQIMLHKNEPDKVYLAIENIFINEEEVPLFLLDGGLDITEDNCPKLFEILSKIFS